MAAPPLLSVLRYAAVSSGYVYGWSRLQYLKGKDAKYQASLAAKATEHKPAH